MKRVFNDGGTLVKTPKFRVSYPNVFEAKAYSEGDEPAFSVVMMFPKGDTDMQHLEQAVRKAGFDKWGEEFNSKALDQLTLKVKNGVKKVRSPFRDGDTDDTYGGKPECEDMIIVRAACNAKFGSPNVVGKDPSSGSIHKIEDPSDFYPGCWAIATINAFAYDGKKRNYGITFGLQNICKVDDGEPFTASTRGSADDDFGEFGDDGESEF